jgi:hypothetical protein
MPPTAILHEVQRLYGVGDRLDSLAEQHPIVSEALLSEALAAQAGSIACGCLAILPLS